MDMGKIRGDYDVAFVEKITENFVNGLGDFHHTDGLREKIREVRARNHDAMFVELLLAVRELQLNEYAEVLRRSVEAMHLGDVAAVLHEAESLLADKMIAYLEEKPKRIAKKGGDALHSRPGGSREKAAKIRAAWATGKYSSRDVCAEQECAALQMSFSSARKALRNTPTP
jgi:hypothetical protein